MKKTWVFRCIGLLLFTISVMLFSGNTSEVHAATSYTNAKEYYNSTSGSRIELYGGNIYTGSRAKSAGSATLKYRTIGFQVTLYASNGTSVDFYVARDGNHFKTVQDEPDSDGYTYSLWYIPFESIKSLATTRNASAANFIFSQPTYTVRIDHLLITVSGTTPSGSVTENGDGTITPSGTVYFLSSASDLARVRAIFTRHDFEGYFKVEKLMKNPTLYIAYGLQGGSVSNGYSSVSDTLYSGGSTYYTSGTLFNTVNLINDSTIGLTKKGYYLPSGQQWVYNYRGTVFNQDADYYTKTIEPDIAYTAEPYLTIEVIANWQANTYYINYDANGGSGSIPRTTLTYDSNGRVASNTFRKTGYKLKEGAEWNTQPDGSGTSYTSNQVVRNLTSTNGATITLYAQWEPCEYKVTTVKDGGTGGLDYFYELYENYFYNSEETKDTAVSSIEVPTRIGYIFNGYYSGYQGLGTQIVDSNGNILVGNTYYTSDNYVFASWTPKEYTVTFDKQGGQEDVGTSQATVHYDEVYPAATKSYIEGYTFKGYYDTPECDGELYYTENMAPLKRHLIDDDITLYAKWVDDQKPTTKIAVSTSEWTKLPEGVSVTGYAYEYGSGLDYVELYSGNTLVAEARNLNGAQTAELNFVHKDEGAFRYRIVAYDLAGNMSESYEYVRYDVTAPRTDGETKYPETDEEGNFVYDEEGKIVYSDKCYYTLDNTLGTESNLSNFSINLFATDYVYDDGAQESAGVYYSNGVFRPWSALVTDGIVTKTSVPDKAFSGDTTIVKVVVSARVTSIGDNAFKGCTKLEEIEIAKSVNTIGDYAFANCKNLEEVVIPEGVTSIGDYAFEGCDSLASITLPESLEDIGDNAFPVGLWTSESTGDIYTSAADIPLGVADTYVLGDAEDYMLLAGSAFNAKIPSEAIAVAFTDREAPEDAEDVSYKQNGNVLAWYDETSLTYYVSAGGYPIYLNYNANTMFLNKSALVYFDFSYLNTSKTTSMQRMFAYVGAEELDLTSFNVSKVTDFSGMFLSSSNLKTVDVTGWDTSSGTTMRMMFARNGSDTTEMQLTNIIGEEDWDTSNVTNFNRMFQHCWNLASLSVGDWDLGSATNTNGMFWNCISITELDVKDWDMSNVTDTSAMFGAIDMVMSLTTLDVSNWDMSNVSKADIMFQNCSNLTELDVSKWVTSKFTDVSYMFYNCSSLTELDVSNWDVSNSISLLATFHSCESITELDLSNWNAVSSTTSRFMLYKCKNLKELKLGNVVASTCTDTCGMFYYCESLEEVDVSGFDMSNVIDIGWMFSNCLSLKSIDVSNWNVSNVENFSCLFQVTGSSDRVSSLKEIIGLENWDTSSGKCFYEMFYRCSVEELDLSSFDTRNVDESYDNGGDAGAEDTDAMNMFGNGSTVYLKKLTLGENFSTTGNGSCNPCVFPTPSSEYITGATGTWTNVDTGVEYLPTEIPSGVAATYEATIEFEAFAVYSEDDNSLNFYKRKVVPAVGETFEGKTVTAVYTGIEELEEWDSIPWSDYALSVTNVSVIDEIKPKSTANWFVSFSSCSNFEVGKLNTSGVENMSLMFYCAGYDATTLKIVGLDNWDVSNVTNMNAMFSLAGLQSSTFDIGNLSGWNTSNVIIMSDMFQSTGLNADWSLDCSNWNVDNVTAYNAFNLYVEFKVTAPTWVN